MAITQSILANRSGSNDEPVDVRLQNVVESNETLIFRERVFYRAFRRGFDVVTGCVAMFVATPILALASLAIVVEDSGPIFFRQRRVGRFGRLFTIYKLRTMRTQECADGHSPTSGRDRRVTRVGYWLRKTSIDELPQLINIIRGEMTLVGPRPEMPFLVRNYENWQHLRHLVTPGLTGFWQISYRKTLPLQRPEATVIDLDYVKHASFFTDMFVLVKTIRQVIFMTGAF
jgi:lipopolysaccharide/colanic/teichoic acid biosynthesis glycosyltransferase